MNDIINEMVKELDLGRPEVQPSKFWIELNKLHNKEELTQNFKRTAAKHYFTWSFLWPWDAQFLSLVRKLPWLTTLGNFLRALFPIKHELLTVRESVTCNFLTHMVWDYAVKTCPDTKTLSEPKIGNPLPIFREGKLISQDLANSAIEVEYIQTHIPSNLKLRRICELGAGYGRTAYVLLERIPKLQYVIVDIPPALYVSQTYLSSVFANKKIFKWRPFTSYQEIREEYEQADIAFLLPSQIELLPAESFDLFVNISSLHEMRIDQIRYYFSQIQRLVKKDGGFYMKEWKVSKIPFENVIIRREDYPLKGWKLLHEQEVKVQTEFFEWMLKKQ